LPKPNQTNLPKSKKKKSTEQRLNALASQTEDHGKILEGLKDLPGQFQALLEALTGKEDIDPNQNGAADNDVDPFSALLNASSTSNYNYNLTQFVERCDI